MLLIDERPRGEFVRQLFLGDSLDSSKLSADIRNGVLTLHVPVDESSKPRRVEIRSAPDETPPGARPDGTMKGDL